MKLIIIVAIFTITVQIPISFNINNQKVSIVTNTSNDLEIYSSNEKLVGDFEVNIKIEKMAKQGFLMIGFNKYKPFQPEKNSKNYFAIGNPDGWGLTSNGYVAEYGKYSLLPYALLNEDNVVKLLRKDNVIGLSINDNFTSYGYLMEGELYLTINLRNKDDSVKIIN